ncbi:leucine-rich repeat-containing protein 57 [Anopheles cruzii]|uniref:leucine-rich repeat-containing protein 57 n=1 Tax=Anopheles cruzii TaxID=68878 RepID=UPI0022EC2828|nr:leucine-rich repeat-containing protein 57 [Anopheles cruzii]
MGNKQVKQHFETAKKTGVLKISLLRLDEFPSALKTFPNVLRTLDISENRFTALPEDIEKFTILKHLNASGNKIAVVPDCIGTLVKLETLNMMNNLLTSVPRSLSNCVHLKQVILSNNQINTFPTMFCDLKHLDLLDLSRNKITEVPPEVRGLQVTELNLNQNQITVVAEAIADCVKLKTLRLEENCLQISAIHSRILSDSKVCNLCVDGNLFNSKQFNELPGYDAYAERYTAVRKKIS